VEGDRHGPGGRRVEEGTAAAYRTGEPGGGDERVLDEFDARLEAVDQAEDAVGDVVPGGGPAQYGRDQLRQPRVVGVSLDDDRAPAASALAVSPPATEKAKGKFEAE